MKRKLIAPMLIVFAIGCAGMKPEAPPVPQTSAQAWNLAKLTYQNQLGLFTEWAKTVESSHDMTPYEANIIRQGQAIHRRAMIVIEQGDKVANGDYADLPLRLNAVLLELQQRYLERDSAGGGS